MVSDSAEGDAQVDQLLFGHLDQGFLLFTSAVKLVLASNVTQNGQRLSQPDISVDVVGQLGRG